MSAVTSELIANYIRFRQSLPAGTSVGLRVVERYERQFKIGAYSPSLPLRFVCACKNAVSACSCSSVALSKAGMMEPLVYGFLAMPKLGNAPAIDLALAASSRLHTSRAAPALSTPGRVPPRRGHSGESGRQQ